jgi:hypothetical protein
MIINIIIGKFIGSRIGNTAGILTKKELEIILVPLLLFTLGVIALIILFNKKRNTRLKIKHTNNERI